MMESKQAFSDASLGGLAMTGTTLGVVHVLGGPDHLSALAVLSVGGSWEAFRLGARWGVGHSLGLILVTIVFVALEGEIDLSSLSFYGDLVVGFVMIGLGIMAVRQAIVMRRRETDDLESEIEMHEERSNLLSEENSPSLEEGTPSLEEGTPSPDENSPSLDENSASSGDTITPSEDTTPPPKPTTTPDNQPSKHVLDSIDIKDPGTQKRASLCVGIVHGVAGPGGILGVMPAITFHNSTKAIIYLASFCLSSIFTMGTFAALYGFLTSKFARSSRKINFYLMLFSATLSFGVGILWLVLLSLGVPTF